jgi:hypothetical protein
MAIVSAASAQKQQQNDQQDQHVKFSFPLLRDDYAPLVDQRGGRRRFTPAPIC